MLVIRWYCFSDRYDAADIGNLGTPVDAALSLAAVMSAETPSVPMLFAHIGKELPLCFDGFGLIAPLVSNDL